MFAIFETGGKQYRADKGAILQIEKLEGKDGDAVVFDKVFLVADGENVMIGAPLVAGATVSAKIVKQDRADKIRVVKFQPKKRHKVIRGHRQPYTEIEIGAIKLASEKKPAAKKAAPKAEKKEATAK